jgi:hypothetical protein
MKNNVLKGLVAIFFLIGSTTCLYAQGNADTQDKIDSWNTLSCEKKNRQLEKIILMYMGDAIDDALVKHYGRNIQSINHIIYVDSGFLTYDVQVEAKTFNGPHNPPYGKDILTFTIYPDGKTELINSEHTDIEEL